MLSLIDKVLFQAGLKFLEKKTGVVSTVNVMTNWINESFRSYYWIGRRALEERR